MNRDAELRSLFLSFAAMVIGCANPVVPADNIVVDAEVRGCSPEIFDTLDPLDVAIVIDTSQSTGRPTGFAMDGDDSSDANHRSIYTDRGDSRLSAQIAALRPLFHNAAGRDIRFSIITFSGPNIPPTVGENQRIGSNRESKIRAQLTDDMALLESALRDVLERGSNGTTVFYAGMQRANRSLIEGPTQQRRKLVLFMSDSPRPLKLSMGGAIQDLDPRMKRAALSARRHGIVFHTFGVSEDSGSWRNQPLGQIAGATGGTYHPVEDPRLFYCHLASSLRPSRRPSDS